MGLEFMSVVIFDIGGVLIDFDLADLLERIAEESRLSESEAIAIWDEPERIQVETGLMDARSYFGHLVDVAGLNWSYQDWVQLWADVYAINNPGMDLLRKLKSKGHCVCILSNLAEFNKEAIDLKYPSFFAESEHNFFSYELGYHKPDPRIYRQVCKALSVSPERCVFIDDMVENADGATAVGMKGIAFLNDRIGEIEREVTGEAI